MQTHTHVQLHSPSHIIKPGTLSFRPIEASLHLHEKPTHPLHVYCKITVGLHKESGPAAELINDKVAWAENYEIHLDRNHNEDIADLDIKIQGGKVYDHVLAEAELELEPIVSKGRLTQQYKLKAKHEEIGEILIESHYREKSPEPEPE